LLNPYLGERTMIASEAKPAKISPLRRLLLKIKPVKTTRTLTRDDYGLVLHLLRGGRLSLGKFEDRFGTGTATIGFDNDGIFLACKYRSIDEPGLILNEDGERVVHLQYGSHGQCFGAKWLVSYFGLTKASPASA
jgi:hypothetical protein